MKTDTDSGASAGPPPGKGPRIHRACRAHVKSPTPKKILVVDDNKIILKTTSAKLTGSGYEVLTAEDGGSAIRLARQLQPHLILLDLNFPPDVGHGGGIPWDGLLILSWLRRTSGMEKVPVIVITGGDLEKYKDRCVEAGVQDIFLKPIDHEALLASIRWALDEEVAEQSAPVDSSDQSPEEPAPEVQPATRGKILFVDDTNDWRYLGLLYLGERGYEVATADDPISAMLKVSQFQPNLVVLDLNLGGQSAVTLLKVLSEQHPEVPILIYTGMDLDHSEVAELLKQGAWNWLRKGSLEKLVTAVEQTMSGPKATVPAELPKKETAKASRAVVASASHSTPVRMEAAPQYGNALPSLDGLRTETPEEFLSAVGKARNLASERTQVVPEPAVVPEQTVMPEPAVVSEPAAIPDAVIQSAAESILIVEDDAAFAETLRPFLESHSFRVSGVTTGAEAVSLIASVDVDIILFDLTLPDFSVQKFYDAVKAVKPHLCTRIIFMSSDDSHPSDDGFVRRRNGISLWKPFPMEWLFEAIQTIQAGTHQNRLAAK